MQNGSGPKGFAVRGCSLLRNYLGLMVRGAEYNSGQKGVYILAALVREGQVLEVAPSFSATWTSW
jgi:hypothetical protein